MTGPLEEAYLHRLCLFDRKTVYPCPIAVNFYNPKPGFRYSSTQVFEPPISEPSRPLVFIIRGWLPLGFGSLLQGHEQMSSISEYKMAFYKCGFHIILNYVKVGSVYPKAISNRAKWQSPLSPSTKDPGKCFLLSWSIFQQRSTPNTLCPRFRSNSASKPGPQPTLRI